MSDIEITAEETNLRTHVQLCRQRHAEIRHRLARMETALWTIVGILVLGGWVTLERALPIARALAGMG